MPKIFISYRRTDSRKDAGRIYDRMVQAFGKENIFKDMDDIPLGADFRRVIADAVTACDVVLAIIGTNWINAIDTNGNRRLDNANDYVRIEIETGLMRENCTVIPVFVDNAVMPQLEELPPTLHELTFRQAAIVRDDPDFHSDVLRLIRNLEQAISDSTKQPQVPDPLAQQEFEWLYIPEGQVSLDEGGYVPPGGKTYILGDFFITEYPITNRQFQEFLDAEDGYGNVKWWNYAQDAMTWYRLYGSGPLSAISGQDDPIVGISWFECIAYCLWISRKLNKEIALPSEQQVHYATRIGRIKSKSRLNTSLHEWTLTDYDNGDNKIQNPAQNRVTLRLNLGWFASSLVSVKRAPIPPKLRKDGLGFRVVKRK